MKRDLPIPMNKIITISIVYVIKCLQNVVSEHQEKENVSELASFDKWKIENTAIFH